MLGTDSILRHLPQRLKARQKLQLEAITFAADLITLGFSSLRQVTERYGESIPSITLHDRVALFAAAWSIVDQMHVLRLLTLKMARPASLVEHLTIATQLRNKMDHLPQQIPNRAAQKGMQTPLFGTLSYFLVLSERILQTDQGPIVKSGQIITITSGSVQGTQSLFAFANPAAKPIHPPVSQFTFTAFNLVLHIEDAIKLLQSYLNELSDLVRDELTAKAEAESARSGSPISDFMSESIHEMVFLLGVDFNAEQRLHQKE